MPLSPDVVNIGLVAHVDAGKTTLTEQLLYAAGAIRAPGSVDRGTAQTDYLELERKRGISIRAASTVLTWKGRTINLIDTPGHTDFASEVERVLRVLDCAVVVISAAEGIQSQTEVLFQALTRLKTPALFFYNKVDRAGADLNRVLEETRERLGITPILVDALFSAEPVPEAVAEALAAQDDVLLEEYLSDLPLSTERLLSSLVEGVRSRRMTAALSGCALKGAGVPALLDLIAMAAPENKGDTQAPVSGVIFRMEHDKAMGRVSHVRLYAGTLHNRDMVRNATRETEEKVVQIRKTSGAKFEDTGLLQAGDIGAVCGLSNARVGDILGDPSKVPGSVPIAHPLLNVRVFPYEEKDYPAVVAAVEELCAEDPLLSMVWVAQERNLLIRITGLIQLEVLEALMISRFGLRVYFSDPTVIYKETPASTGEGFVAYTMPKPCWAVLRFRIEPGERGSGIRYKSIVKNDDILYRYQAQVAQALPDALRQGPLGWEVTDAKITLIDGEHHNEHTHPLDFIVATPMAMMDGLVNTGTTLLEPMQAFRLSLPEEAGGKAMGEIIRMRGQFDTPVVRKGTFTLEGRVPAATSMEFPVWAASVSSGRANLSVRFDGYEPCPLELGSTAPYRGVNPLDQARYILSIRGAL